MKFSVIVPAHNAEKTLSKCLQSIKEQTFKDYEIIVVCDSCVDDTYEIAKLYTNKVYKCEYRSDGPTRNVGLEHAKSSKQYSCKYQSSASMNNIQSP